MDYKHNLKCIRVGKVRNNSSQSKRFGSYDMLIYQRPFPKEPSLAAHSRSITVIALEVVLATLSCRQLHGIRD